MLDTPLPKTIKSLLLGKYKVASNTQVQIYLLGDTLLDTGPPNQWKPMMKFLQDNPPRQILLTHHHEDHAGNVKRIAKFAGSRAYISGGKDNPLARGFSIKPYQHVIWGRPEKFSAAEIPEEIFTSNGHRLIPIKTPGHSPDHTAFFEPDRKWLFSGDLYVGARPYLFRSDENLGEEIIALQKLLELDFEGLFCGHMGFFADGRKRIETKLAYLENLVQNAQELAAKGFSPEKIADRLLKKSTFTSLITLGHFSRKNLVLACLAVRRQRETKANLQKHKEET